MQTLGSAPDWKHVKLSVGSDEETKGGPTQLFKKKKKKKKQRCKKLKKTSATEIEGDVGMEKDILQKPVKKHQAKLKVDTAITKRSRIQAHKTVCFLLLACNLLITVILYFAGSTENSTEERLSRRQWKNKMKNKRRRTNKFSPNSAEVADPKLEEKLRQAKDLPIADVPVHTDTSEKAQAIPKKVNKDIHQLTPIKLVCKGLKTKAHNQCEKQGPLKLGKNSWLQTKSLLNISSTESSEKLSNINLEQKKDFKTDGECQIDRSSALRSRMEKRLQSARFRFINELLYTSTSGEAKRMFTQDPDAIGAYHKGYTEQVKHWPANPVDSIISYIQRRYESCFILILWGS